VNDIQNAVVLQCYRRSERFLVFVVCVASIMKPSSTNFYKGTIHRSIVSASITHFLLSMTVKTSLKEVSIKRGETRYSVATK
jgi:hypothetical protein